MESDILNELFDLINEKNEENTNDYTVSQIINLIKNSDKYNVFLEVMSKVEKDLFVDDEIHGIAHNERVALYACAIGIMEGLDAKNLRILLEAAKYHDIGRKEKTGPTGEHGLRSAEILEQKRAELLPDFNDEEINIMKALCIGHNSPDSKMEEIIKNNSVTDIENCKKILVILKDADALDRVRLPRFGKLKEEFLRTEHSKKMISTSKEMYKQYNEAKEIVKYKKEFVKKQFDSSLFEINSYNLIEDDENYYVFRTINSDNEDELDDEYELYLKTSRERAEMIEKAVKYNKDSDISLEEIYDNIKVTHGNKETNCISFSTNANVSLDYRNDRFVMLKVPKKDIGNLYVSGKFMLEEIDKIINDKLDELLENEEKNKEILSLISQVNEMETTSGIKEVVARSYKGVKNTNEKYTGSGNSILTKSAVMNRFTKKQYFNEKQQLEYNKLVAKLTILETRGKIKSILPTQITNTSLLASIGTAFSSSEMVHYKEILKNDLTEISKENMEMFAILQQAEHIQGVSKSEIEELKKDFLDAVLNGYELRTYNGQVVYSNGSHRINLGSREEFKGIFEERKVLENAPIEDAYNTLKVHSDSTKAIPYIKGNAAIDFVRKMAVAKLKKDEYWKVLSKVSPGFDFLINIASKKTINTESEIISRLNKSGVQLSESVNIDISNPNLRKLFSQNEIEGLWNKINSLSEKELNELISGDFDFIKNGFFRSIIEGKEYKGGENEYYSELITDSLDLTKVYTYLKPGSKKIESVKEALKEKLNNVNSKKLYLSLYKIGIPEEEISNYITNLILDDGIGKDIESFEKLVNNENLEQVLLEYKENLTKKVSAYRLNVFLGIKDNDYIVPETEIKLRDYQKEAFDNIKKIYAKNKKFVGVKLPTGAGKSFVAMAEMMRRKKENMVYFAPQEEILSQVQRHIVKYILDKEILNERHVSLLTNMSKEERKVYLENKIYNPTVNVNKLLDDLKNTNLTEEEREKIVRKILPRNTDSTNDIMDAIHTVLPHLEMCCYQSLTASKFEELKNKKIDFAVFDELHRTGADTWKEQIDSLLKSQEDTDILGITATPIRDVDGVDMMEEMAKNYGGFTAEELVDKEYYAAEMSLIEAMQRKLVVEPIIVPFNRSLRNLPEYVEIENAISELEKKGSNPKLLEKLKINLSEMDKIIEDDRPVLKGVKDELVGIEKVFAENIPESKKNGKFIVFIPQKPNNYSKTSEEYVKEKIQETKEYFSDVTDKIMTQYLLSNRAGGEKENAKVIAEFESLESDELKLLYAINKLNEGVHVDGISGEIMLRPIGAGSNILYFQQIGRVIYAIDPDNPPSENDIPIIFDVYDNYIARDLDREANYTTTVSDLSRLQEIINWMNKHETLPDIDSNEKAEVGKAIALRKIQKKYSKYINGINNPNLTSSEIYEIEKILELGKSINLFELEFKDRDENIEEMDFRVRTFEVKGEQKRFLEIYEESKRAIKHSEYRAKATDQIKIREGVTIFKVLSSYGLAITDESFEEINQNKDEVNLFDYINKNFDFKTTREILNELKISTIDAEEIEVYKVFDYLRNSFMHPDAKVRKYFSYYDITDLRKCGIFKKDGDYIPVINSKGFVLKEDILKDGYKAPSSFVNLNIMTGTKYDEEGYNIDGYDVDGYDRQGYDINGYDRDKFRKGRIYNIYGFDRNRIHNKTNTHLDENFFDMDGYFWKENPDFPDDINKRIKTDSKLNEYFFDRDGYYYELDEEGNWQKIGFEDRYGFALGDKVNKEGFKRDRNHSETGRPWDKYGYDIDKIYWKEDPKNPGERIKTDSKLNNYHFDRDGYFYKRNEKGIWEKRGKVDEQGFAFGDEINGRGFYRNRIHYKTNKPFDEYFFDIDCNYWEPDPEDPLNLEKRRVTNRKYDGYGKDASGKSVEGIEQKEEDELGFERGSIWNKKGFNREGIHRETGKPWNKNFFGIDGFYWKANPENPNERIKTNKKVNEQNINNAGYYCIEDDDGKFVELHKYRDEFWRCVKKKEETDHSDVFLFEDGAYDNSGYWWKYDKNTGKYTKTSSKMHPIKNWDKDGYDSSGKEVAHDDFGFKPDNTHINGTHEDDRGFNYKHIHKLTNKPYDLEGFDIEEYYWEIDPLDNSKRIRTNHKHNEYGATVQGDCEQDLQGYDDIGMLNFETHINENFKKKEPVRYLARKGEKEKLFRKANDNAYYYLDSKMEYNPKDGLDYEGFNSIGFNCQGKFKGGQQTKVYKIYIEENDDLSISYDDIEDIEISEYEDLNYEYSPRNRIRRIIEERKDLLKSEYESTIKNIKTNNGRYREHYAPARLRAAQSIRDTWDMYDENLYDEDGNPLVDSWQIEEQKSKEEKEWEEYLKEEDEFLKTLKENIELDMHGFDSDGVFYIKSSDSGINIATPTKNMYDKHGFDKYGYYGIVDEDTGKWVSTERKVDPRGFDQNGFFHDPDTGECNSIYDRSGYNIEGYNRYGFNNKGLTVSGLEVNEAGFKADGTCVLNNGLRYTKTGFTMDGINIYTGTYRDLFGRTQEDSTELPKAEEIVDSEKKLNAYGINPYNGKNEYGYIDPTIRYARYYFSEILEFGRDRNELLESLSEAYRVPLNEMKLLSHQKIFIAMNGFPKLQEEIQEYFIRGKREIDKNYDMYTKITEEQEKRNKKKLPTQGESPQDQGVGFDDDL